MQSIRFSSLFYISANNPDFPHIGGVVHSANELPEICKPLLPDSKTLEPDGIYFCSPQQQIFKRIWNHPLIETISRNPFKANSLKEWAPVLLEDLRAGRHRTLKNIGEGLAAIYNQRFFRPNEQGLVNPGKDLINLRRFILWSKPKDRVPVVNNYAQTNLLSQILSDANIPFRRTRKKRLVIPVTG